MINFNNFQLINLNQIFDSVKFRSGSGYHLIIDFYIVMFYMLMILMKFSFVQQSFCRVFFLRIRIRILKKILKKVTMKSIGKSYYTKDTHQIWCRSSKFLSKSKSCSRSG